MRTGRDARMPAAVRRPCEAVEKRGLQLRSSPDTLSLTLPSALLQVRVWLRPMAEVGGGSGGDSSGSSSGSDPGEADFAEYAPAGGAPTAAPVLGRLARGWTAFVVGVVAPRGCDG